MNETEIRDKIRQYVLSAFVRDENFPLADDEGIITGGFMDSTDLTELALFIEEQFDVIIPDPQLTVAQMDTLNLIVARVLRG